MANLLLHYSPWTQDQARLERMRWVLRLTTSSHPDSEIDNHDEDNLVS